MIVSHSIQYSEHVGHELVELRISAEDAIAIAADLPGMGDRVQLPIPRTR